MDIREHTLSNICHDPYPPPQGQYPPPPGAYPPDTGYPPQGYPPPYSGDYKPPPDPQQQTHTNVVVVQQQPTTTVVTTHVATGIPDYFVLSIVMTILCFFFNICALVCTIPAIFLANQSREEALRGNREQAIHNARLALYLNIAAVVFFIVLWIIVIAASAAS